MFKRQLNSDIAKIDSASERPCTRLQTNNLIKLGTFEHTSLERVASHGTPPTNSISSSLLEGLPNELLSNVYCHLDPAGMLAFKFTSRTLNAATLKRNGTQLIKFKHARSELVSFQTMMVEIEANLPKAIKCRLLTCSGCFRTLGHGRRGEERYKEKKKQERRARRESARQNSTSTSRLIGDDNDSDSMGDLLSDSDESDDSLMHSCFVRKSFPDPGIADGSMLSTRGLKHDHDDLSKDGKYGRWLIFPPRNCFSDEHFKRSRRDRMCTRCVGEKTNAEHYFLGGRRQMKCEECHDFFDEETGPSKKVLRQWRNQKEHKYLFESGELKAVDIACGVCFREWKAAACEEEESDCDVADDSDDSLLLNGW